MKIALFYHSLYSDWNHGNAHFLRGVVRELLVRGHDVRVYEPKDGWSMQNLIKDHGLGPVEEFKQIYPNLASKFFEVEKIDLKRELDGTDLVIVHEWNETRLISSIGKIKKEAGFRLLFHDTHHRAVSDPESLSRFDFSQYDGVLAFGGLIKNIYMKEGWVRQGWTWHEAADIHIFKPQPDNIEKEGDLVWIGNWGDNERSEELHEFLIQPVKELGLKAKVYGVRYPKKAREALLEAGIEYGGWLPNYRVPEVFSKYRATVHVPRRPYVKLLPGIPTIRPFEAMACGIPLICSPWNDSENLFTEGRDYLIARDKEDMKQKLKLILNDIGIANGLAKHGMETIIDKHTCSIRVDQLEKICGEMGLNSEVMETQTQQINDR
jgi:spore maturation protein CgeB